MDGSGRYKHRVAILMFIRYECSRPSVRVHTDQRDLREG